MPYRLSAISLSISLYLRLMFFEKILSQFSVVYMRNNNNKIHQTEVACMYSSAKQERCIQAHSQIFSTFVLASSPSHISK